MASSIAAVAVAAAVPPDILDYPTSTDMVVREGSNVTLKCAATGSPEPTITWRRESGVPIELASGEEGKSALPMAFSIQFGLPVSPMVKCMHDSLCMYECVYVCVCGSMCECVLSGKYFLLLLPPAAA